MGYGCSCVDLDNEFKDDLLFPRAIKGECLAILEPKEGENI